MICKQCGAFFEGKGVFCPHCGSDNSDLEKTLDLDKTMSAEEFTPPEGFPPPPASPQEVQPPSFHEPSAEAPVPQDHFDVANDDADMPSDVPLPSGEQSPQNDGKKKNTGLIVLICVLSALLVGVLITMLVLWHPWRSTAAPVTTTAPTSAPVETTVQPKTMPDLVGLTKEDAISKLAEMGVGVRDIVETETDSAEPGYVFNQSPSKNWELTPDTNVTIYVAVEKSTQPPVETTEPTTEQPTASSPGYGTTLYVTADEGAALRAEASDTGRELATVSRGEAVTYLQTAGDYYYVSYRGIKGYIFAGSLSAERVDQASVTGSDDLKNGDPLYCINGEGAKLRSDTSIFSSELATLRRGDRVTFLGQSGDWYYVSYNGRDGYVLMRDFSAQES